MPAPLKPTRRVRKLPQAPNNGGATKTRSRGPPPKLPPRTSIGAKPVAAAAASTPPTSSSSVTSSHQVRSRKAVGTAADGGGSASVEPTPSTTPTPTPPPTTTLPIPTAAAAAAAAAATIAPAIGTAGGMVCAPTPKLNKRQTAVAALVAAEQAFGKKIGLLESVFGKIARTPDAFAPLRDLLLTAPPLTDVCNTLVAELVPKLNPTSTSKIGDLFCAHASRLAVYSAFCGQVEAASLALEESLEDGTPIFLMVEECEGDRRCETLSFLECCRLPRQHLAQYVGRLEAVLAVTPEDHHDFNPVSEAIERIGAAVAQVSSESQHLATLLNVLRIQTRIPGTDLSGLQASPEMLLKEGPLEWRGTSSTITAAGAADDGGAATITAPQPTYANTKKRKLHLFLFSNRLIITIPKPGARAGGERTYVAVDPAQLGKDADPAVKRRSWGGAAGATKVGVLDGAVSGWKLKGNAFMLAHDFEEVRPDRQALMELHAEDDAAAAEWLEAISKMA